MNPTDTQQLQDRAREFQERVGPPLESALNNLAAVNKRVSSFIKENPATCLVGALALGFLVGKLASRR